MILSISYLLLPVAATWGWFSGRKSKNILHKKNKHLVRRDLFQGLSYLINQQPDKAVDVFIKLLHIDSDTVEIHLALGALFRKQGDVARAIRVHQNVIARPKLSNEHRMLSMLALAKDFLASGVLNRAEHLLLELIRYGYEERQVYDLLVTIYQQEKDWAKSIQVVKKIQSKFGCSEARLISHFYCELASKAISQRDYGAAKAYLHQAGVVYKQAIRPAILQAHMEFTARSYSTVIKLSQDIERKGLCYLFELLPECCESYLKEGRGDELRLLLERMLLYSPEFFVRSMKPDVIPVVKDMQLITSELLEKLCKNGSLFSLFFLLEYGQSKKHDLKVNDLLENLQCGLQALVNNHKKYQCDQCGFSVQDFLWLCPGCQSWGGMQFKSVIDL